MNRRALVHLFVPLSLGLLAACGDSSGPAASAAPTATLTSVPFTGDVPTMPANGNSRAGTVYSVQLKGEVTGDTVGITVFEPTTLTGGKHYPLVLHSHGYGASRQKSTSSDPVTGTLSPGDINGLLAAGYGAISISERGSDDSTGTIRVMDPDYEGHDLLTVLDWAEANLGWLMYGPSADGSDAHNLVVGSIGGSYGGMYQYLIHNVDPKRRLDAMVPQIAPNDLTYSLFPNNTIKAGWDSILFLAGDSAGQNLDRGHTDAYITNFFAAGLSTNQIAQDGRDFFYYHSNQYFCDSKTVAGNGDFGAAIGMPGVKLKPGYAPTRGPRVNAMVWQGMRDTLFTFNNAYANYLCLKGEGGDVRLLSYQSGHNSLQAVPDVGNHLYQPVGNELDSNCGNINVNTATVAFFNEYLMGIPGAANKVVPTKTCLSLTKGDAVLVDAVTAGKSGKQYTVPSTTVVAGLNLDIPTAIDLGITAGRAGEVVGGIPHVEVDIAKVNDALPGEPIVFVGLGQTRNGVPGVYDLLDNQITPLRGTGHFDVDLVGVAERLSAGDQLVLLVYGLQDQYHVTGSVNLASPAIVPVTIAGKVWVPMLGNLVNAANS